MQIAHQNWPAVEHYLTTRSVLLIPIGSTEQHGPNGLIGTDHLVAESLARSVGEEMGILVAPPWPMECLTTTWRFPDRPLFPRKH
ncbi:putative creatininase [Leptospirillum ferriphilum ML-04]|uniref:Putative creatininase n=1 Tax=Leptospirillum ferriphilum (strain ML-04) TaxID=1048260 RepID=J9ZE16_LEPFM|nr:putative creatininase [Leptospirillum ferriphilum ML-04]